MGYGPLLNSFAVEFDTVLNTIYDDPNGNHVGLDLNGNMTSFATWSPTASLNNGLEWFCWVEYVGSSMNLAIFVSTTSSKPSSPQITTSLSIYSLIQNSQFYVGFGAGTGDYSERHRVISLKVSIDQCTPSPCFNGGTCSNIFNGFACSCPFSYYGVTCSSSKVPLFGLWGLRLLTFLFSSFLS